MAIFEALSLIHGFLGTIFLMSFTGALIALISFNEKRTKLLVYSISLMTLFVILIDILGVYLYTDYRSQDPESAKSKILSSKTPWVHEILFEFKEFAGIYVALMMILINFLVRHYKSAILTEKKLRNSTIVLLLVTMLLTLLTYGLGAYVTKVQPL